MELVSPSDVPAEAFRVAENAIRSFSKRALSIQIPTDRSGAASSKSGSGDVIAEACGQHSVEQHSVETCLTGLPSILYCRVDLLWNNDHFAVSEFESLDPELFFRLHKPLAPALVAAIQSLLRKKCTNS